MRQRYFEDAYYFLCSECNFNTTVYASDLKIATGEAVRRHNEHVEESTAVKCENRCYKIVCPDGSIISIEISQ